MSRIVICGTTGFIGRNLVEHFSRRAQHEIIAVGHQREAYEQRGGRWVEADLRMPARKWR